MDTGGLINACRQGTSLTNPLSHLGRDCIGIAKTGSGKTLAFVLPMLHHIMAQHPLQPGDGPMGLIMAPTRELVDKISRDIRKLAKVEGVTCAVVSGLLAAAAPIVVVCLLIPAIHPLLTPWHWIPSLIPPMTNCVPVFCLICVLTTVPECSQLTIH